MKNNPNLADPKQVEEARLKEDDIRKKQLNDIRAVLKDSAGRRFMWRLLSHCKSFSTPYHPEPNEMYKNVGAQDVGRFLMAEITSADENLLLKLMKDNKKELAHE